MVVGEIADTTDVVVIGGGPGGYVAAIRAAQLGKHVVLVEAGGRAALGGTCLRVGGIPSKALVELADFYDRVAGTKVAGLPLQTARVDMAAFHREMEHRITRLNAGIGQLLDQCGVTVLGGNGRFSTNKRIAIERDDGYASFVEFTGVVIATGSSARALPMIPFDGVSVLDSSAALALGEVPAVMTVVGAGYIGMELSTAFAKMGSKVTIVEAQGQILPTLDRDLIMPLLPALKRLGVHVLVNTSVVGVDGDELIVSGPTGERRVERGTTVVTVGRAPNTDDIGLGRAGLKADCWGYLTPDDRCLLRNGVAAVGDVTSGPSLAHRAMAQATVAAEALAGLPSRFEPSSVPVVIFTDPEIATVGLTESEARNQEMDVATGFFPVSASGRAATLGRGAGFTKLVVDLAGDRIVGGCMVGPHASDAIAEIGLAVEMMASPRDLLGTIHPHPTMSESIHEAAALAMGEPRHGLR